MKDYKMKVLKDGTSVRRYKWQPYSLSGSPWESWEIYESWNITQPCQNSACNNLRSKRGKYCNQCGLHCTLLGDPRYRRVRLAKFKKETNIALEVIEFNIDNAVVVDFVDKITTIASQAKQGLNVEWREWMSSLYDYFDNYNRKDKGGKWGTHPIKILSRLVGAYIFYETTGGEIIKTEKMWHVLLADIVLYGMKKKLKPSVLSAYRVHRFGKYIWSLFALHMIKIGRAVIKNENDKKLRAKQLEDAEILIPATINEKGVYNNGYK